MTKDELIKLALEAGFANVRGGLMDDGKISDYWDCWPGQLQRFASLVAAAEREAWREESERTADAHLKQGLTIAELFEQRDALLEALQNIERSTYDTMTATLARAAIAAAEGEKT